MPHASAGCAAIERRLYRARVQAVPHANEGCLKTKNLISLPEKEKRKKNPVVKNWVLRSERERKREREEREIRAGVTTSETGR